MKRFLRFLWLRAYDLLLSAGRPPYQYTDWQAYRQTAATYSLRKALRVGDRTPAGLDGRSKVPVSIPSQQPFWLKVDRLGRVHLPKALRERIL